MKYHCHICLPEAALFVAEYLSDVSDINEERINRAVFSIQYEQN